MFTTRRWYGQDNVPATGGVIIAANHLSWVDPFTLGHFVYQAGRIPRFMAKESIFRLPVIGWIVRGADQIPVHRGERDGAAALSDAVEALRDGEAVLIYPEGTITRDPDWWPMHAKTGVARLALMSGAPIIPVAQWGPQEILGRKRRLHLFPRRTVEVHALEAVYPPASETGQQPTREALRALTVDVMKVIRDELAVIRGEAAPEGIWDPREDERIMPSPPPTPDEGAA
ncbi:MAG TPA: lysophospholipid acyltransferase family protein [Frankiaceae bacterium]|nr:lysophospholipid acyltransferase family protein [Frankiaceae bacterium]